MLRFEATQLILKYAGDRPVVANLGPTTDELWHAQHRDRNFYTYGNMGLCSSLALGMAVSTDEQVISLDGDGSLLMNLGAIATIGREQPKNLIVVVWDNEKWDQTGHQPGGPAAQLDRGPVTHGDHRGVERLVCAVAAQPLGDRQVRHSTTRVADPASLAAQRPLVELSQHRHPALGSAARRCALGGSPSTGRPPQ